MEKKKWIVSSALALSLAALVAAALPFGLEKAPAADATITTYSLTFSLTNCFKDGSGDDVDKTLHTDLGNPVAFVYRMIAPISGTCLQAFQPGSYFYNTDPITNLDTLNMMQVGQSFAFTIEYGATAALGSSGTLGRIQPDDYTTFTFPGTAHYFKVSCTETTTVAKIEAIQLIYDCA
jgi:hypothetical protein